MKPSPQDWALLCMRPDMIPQPALVYFDKQLKIRGVDIVLRVFPATNAFVFSSSRELNVGEKVAFANYMRNEGFLDDPIAGTASGVELV